MSAHGGDQERSRFVALWRRCLAEESTRAAVVHAQLAEFYGEPHRHYHTLTHIRHCLYEFDRATALMDDPDAVEMALWFHDAIYAPGAADNEQRSADLFRGWTKDSMDSSFRQRVCDLIMATTHREPPTGQDEGFIVDIDLSSFGLSWEECARDGRLIRAECADVADDEYYPGHLRFLLALQSRPVFFFTDFFQQCYGQVARANVDRIVADLRARGYGGNR